MPWYLTLTITIVACVFNVASLMLWPPRDEPRRSGRSPELDPVASALRHGGPV